MHRENCINVVLEVAKPSDIKDILARLDGIERVLAGLVKEVRKQMADIKTEMANLTAQVKANTDAEASAIVLIEGIAAALKNAANDPAAVAALAAQLKTSADALGAAVVANTPPTP